MFLLFVIECWVHSAYPVCSFRCSRLCSKHPSDVQQMAEAEQHFILRVQDPELADKLRGWLRDGHTLDIRLLFDRPDSDRKGVLTVDGEQHEVWLQDLPTVVESYKTLDDANLVKVTDIGQVR